MVGGLDRATETPLDRDATEQYLGDPPTWPFVPRVLVRDGPARAKGVAVPCLHFRRLRGIGADALPS